MGSQFFGSRQASAYGNVGVAVPRAVSVAAKESMALAAAGFRGGTKTGFLRAEQLARESHVPWEDLRFMRNWYARHVVTSYPGYARWRAAGSPRDDARFHRVHGILAWMIWGGDAGLAWVNRMTPRLNQVFGTKYKKIVV